MSRVFRHRCLVSVWILVAAIACCPAVKASQSSDTESDSKSATTAADKPTTPDSARKPEEPLAKTESTDAHAIASGEEPLAEKSDSDEKSQNDEGSDPENRKLIDVLNFAQDVLNRIDEEVRDYTCTLVRRERVDGEWPSYFQRLEAKVRHEHRGENEAVEPFAVFIEFQNPRRMAGRRVLYVTDRWHGDLVARRGGSQTPNMTRQLDPSSPLAMEGNRYPITEIGIRNLTARLIAFMQRELDHDDCEVKIFKNAKLQGRACTHIQVTQTARRPDSRFRVARVLIDNELKLPVYFASFGWGKTDDDKPVPLEEYAYINIKINVGLTDLDFDLANPAYEFQLLEPVAESGSAPVSAK